MAWRLVQSGMPPVAVLVEKRSRMIRRQGPSVFSLFLKLGAGFFWKKFWETVHIRGRFYWRKASRVKFKDPVYFSIEEWALDHPSVRVYEVEDHNGPETQELLWRLEPDIGLLTNTRRIKKEILEIPRHGFLNLHLSALPKYAGLDSIFWALYHGEKEIGVTVHQAAPEIDRGDILIQKRIPVAPFDNEESLYGKALWLGTSLMVRALKQLEEGTLERRPQDRSQATYFSWPTSKDRALLRRKPPSAPRRIQVVHVITRMTRGGAQENTLATVLNLKKRGYSVALVTGSSWGREGEILSEVLEEGLEVAVLPELIREVHPWRDPMAFMKLSSWLARNRCVILHTHMSKAGFLGRLSARLLAIPVVIHTPHGHVFHSYFHPWKERLFLALERIAARGSDRLIALTERCRLEHLERGVGTPEKWVTIPSGVDELRFLVPSDDREAKLSHFRIPPGRKIIGFIGRLAPVKGASYLIEALPKIFQRVPESHCFLVGDGEEKRALQARVEELGLTNHVTFTGHRHDVPEFLSLFDVLVVPSLNEGMGRVIVEAGILQRAVVGTRVGGVPDLIEDGKTGILIEPRNPAEIARSVIRFLEDPEFSKRLGKELQTKVLDGFTERQMVEKIHSLYQEVLQEKGFQRQPSLPTPECVSP